MLFGLFSCLFSGLKKSFQYQKHGVFILTAVVVILLVIKQVMYIISLQNKSFRGHYHSILQNWTGFLGTAILH